MTFGFRLIELRQYRIGEREPVWQYRARLWPFLQWGPWGPVPLWLAA